MWPIAYPKATSVAFKPEAMAPFFSTFRTLKSRSSKENDETSSLKHA
jgi:hypothetical protein